MNDRIIAFETIRSAVAELCRKAACELPDDVKAALTAAAERETSPLARDFFSQYRKNWELAGSTGLPLCQDTGFAVYFVDFGDRVKVDGGTLAEAIEAGTRDGYTKHYLRKSIDSDPLFHRKNTGDNTPPVIHWNPVAGDRLHITLAPKGGGSENMSALKMLKPADGRAGVVKFVTESVIRAGGNPCPPTIVGVGIGGTMEKAAFLAKHALLRRVGEPNPDPDYAALEQEILDRINSSNVGEQGLGGAVTSLAVHIEWFPCHLASLPVAVNLNCHAARHAEVEL